MSSIDGVCATGDGSHDIYLLSTVFSYMMHLHIQLIVESHVSLVPYVCGASGDLVDALFLTMVYVVTTKFRYSPLKSRVINGILGWIWVLKKI